jgi:acyl carrier protein
MKQSSDPDTKTESFVEASDGPETDVAGEFVPPRTATEKTLAEIWTRVLKVEQVGVYDYFFELGGDSLLATQVVSRARETFQIDLPLSSLFEAPTLAELAQVVDDILRAGLGTTVAAITSRGDFEEIEL